MTTKGEWLIRDAIMVDSFTAAEIGIIEEAICEHDANGTPFKIAGPKSLYNVLDRYQSKADYSEYMLIGQVANKCSRMDRKQFKRLMEVI